MRLSIVVSVHILFTLRPCNEPKPVKYYTNGSKGPLVVIQ
jgi:hypothetical protein